MAAHSLHYWPGAPAAASPTTPAEGNPEGLLHGPAQILKPGPGLHAVGSCKVGCYASF